jgi:dTDP-4-dehydrorhamnose 3,5-epimerase
MTQLDTRQTTRTAPAPRKDNGDGVASPPYAIGSPRVFDGELTDAHAWALEAREPAMLPAPVYTDDRGWSVMNQMQGVLRPAGQINFSVMYPNVIKAWHRHRLQTDMWLCLTGHLKVGIHRESDGRSWQAVIGEKRPMIVVIPPPLWHGAATVGPDSAGLLYYVTHAYNARDPDEQRRAYDSVPGFGWGVAHR